MKKELKQLSFSKELISKLHLDKVEGGNALLQETRLSDTCLCGSDPDIC
ncbi:hypothetical protein [Dokdonia pacifica]|uniref:Uncharacterized protein n=1 Tax=Dokdonia pacifica TaxID=1627892 RepID=A0A239E2Q9_9FLAO|nr:hypothetical protein [Dokdonia pacifica]SNS38966.1 hypothetical protein SAMN06265376_11370 [Dokdonia pacifica]